MSTTLRQAYLKAVGALGIKQFVAKSALGYDFVCHIGDFGSECQFYNPKITQTELIICATWLKDENNPVVFDVGANVGFVATQLAQILVNRTPTIYAFEPVPTTFMKLMQSVKLLGLNELVHPIAAAVLDELKAVQFSYSDRDSIFAQIKSKNINLRVGAKVGHAAGITLDSFYSSTGIRPTLLKIDVEGAEVAVLRGAQALLAGSNRPAILFEYNPVTLSECGAAAQAFRVLLPNYKFHYVDDFEGQKLEFGSPIDDVKEIQWVCNIFAVPIEDAPLRWNSVLKHALARLSSWTI